MTARMYTLDDFRRYLHELPRHLEEAAVRGIHAGAMRAIPIAQRAGDNAPPASERGARGARDTGAYRQRWRAELTSDGAILRNLATHAPTIEGGRRAGAKGPPSKAIEAWARRRLGLSEAEAKIAAYPISRAIARRGLRARHVLAGAHSEIVRVVLAEMKREITASLRAVRMRRHGGEGRE